MSLPEGDDTQPHDEVPSVLYHYTTATGLIGIMTSRRLWATDILYLNDASELDYTFDLFRQALTESPLSSRLRLPALNMDPMEIIISAGTQVSKSVAHVCVASLCEDPDLLSQWRGYSHGTAGFAIGFKSRELVADGRLDLKQIEYSQRVHKKAIQSLVDEVDHEIDLTTPEGIKSAFDSKRWSALFVRVLGLASEYKHPKFNQEAEWRARSDRLLHKGMLIRETSLGLTPYVTLKVSDPDDKFALVSDIVIGPCREPELSERAVRSLLGATGLDQDAVNVVHSEIPLRT